MPARPPPPLYCIPSVTPVCVRVAILEHEADDGTRAPVVRAFAAAVARRAAATARGLVPGLAQAALAGFALRAVQALPYYHDPPGEEWFAPAWYTAQHGGDCDKLVVLLVAVCRVLGVPAQVVWITQKGLAMNHVTAGVHVNGVWLWADPAIKGARLGESPYEAVQRVGAWDVIGGRAPASHSEVSRG